MVGIVPSPGRNTTIVVTQDPVQTIEISLSNFSQRCSFANFQTELFAIVRILPRLQALLATFENQRPLRSVHHCRVDRNLWHAFGVAHLTQILVELLLGSEIGRGTTVATFSSRLLLLFLLDIHRALFQHLSLERRHDAHDLLQTFRVKSTPPFIASDITSKHRQRVVVHFEERVQRALGDVQRRQSGQEIVPNEHAQ